MRKVSNSSSYYHDHSMSFALVPFDRTYIISYRSSVATMSLCGTVSEILSVISPNLTRSPDPEHILFGGDLSCTLVGLNLLIRISQHTKFEMSSFIYSKDMIEAPEIKNGSRDSDHAHWG